MLKLFCKFDASNEIPIDLPHLQAELALIMSLMGRKMLTNMAYLQYRPR